MPRKVQRETTTPKEKLGVWLTEDERKNLDAQLKRIGFNTYASFVRHISLGGGVSSDPESKNQDHNVIKEIARIVSLVSVGEKPKQSTLEAATQLAADFTARTIELHKP